MRPAIFLLPIAAAAAPAAAAPAPQPREIQIPAEISDPAMAEKLGNMVQALSRAFLDLKVGEVKAAAEGRQATPAEKQMTVRDMGRRDDPNFDRNLERQIAKAKPMIQQTMSAFARSLPAMTKAMSEMAGQMERAVENMPRPDYPRR